MIINDDINNPHGIDWEELKKAISTFPKSMTTTRCDHPEHNFPMMLYIPPGQSYTHVCPHCGYRITVAGEPISL